jgi:CheY-like chemotaxis protein/HPt (histidine-containing phosphotransfer) domain-containing protein
MWVESQVGVGTTFHFTIQAQAAPSPIQADLDEVRLELGQRRLLIVDDNLTNRLILTRQAEAWGMAYRETSNPLEALAWLREGEQFDVAILDMHMPEMDGLSLAMEIRHLEESGGIREQGREETRASGGGAEEKEDIKSKMFLVMSTSLANRDMDRKVEFEQANFAAYLNKPLKPSQLLDILMTIFSGQPTYVRRREELGEIRFDPQMGQRLPLRILLAEDHPTNQKLALAILARLSYRADIAGNGLEAVEALDRQPYDVVLMDMQMPEVDGLEATRQIRQRWAAQTGPYIIAMTANAMQSDREACLAAGMNDYVSKPIRVNELMAALNRGAALRYALPQELEQRRGPSTGSGTGAGEQGSKGAEEIMFRVQSSGFRVNSEPGTKNPELEAEGTAEQSQIPNPKSQIENPLDPAAMKALLEVLGGEREVLLEIIDSVLEVAPSLLDRLHQGIAQNNPAEVRAAAHSLKSSSKDFGATRLAELCQTLEEMAKAGTLEGAAELAPQVETEYEQVKAALEAERAA